MGNDNIFFGVKHKKTRSSTRLGKEYTTASLLKYIRGLHEGIVDANSAASPIYANLLLKKNVNFIRDSNENREFELCKDDMFYFINKYARVNGTNFIMGSIGTDIITKGSNLNLIMTNTSDKNSDVYKILGYIVLYNMLFKSNRDCVIQMGSLSQEHSFIVRTLDLLTEIPHFLQSGVNKSLGDLISFTNENNIYSYHGGTYQKILFNPDILIIDSLSKVVDSEYDVFIRGHVPNAISDTNCQIYATNSPTANNFKTQLFQSQRNTIIFGK